MTSETSRTQQDMTVDFPRLASAFPNLLFSRISWWLRVQFFLDQARRGTRIFSAAPRFIPRWPWPSLPRKGFTNESILKDAMRNG